MRAEESITWPVPSAGERVAPVLNSNDVHVWAGELEVPQVSLAGFAATLSKSEQDRAARFHFERHRHRFIVGRGMLRVLLSRYLRCDPRTLEFTYGVAGKPRLPHRPNEAALQFNLAHSDDLALIALTRGGQVGIDVERIRPLRDAEELVARFFSPREHQAFKRLDEDKKPAAFFSLWTRKEAWLKATGEGIAHSLHLVEVSFVENEPARLLTVPSSLDQGLSWSLLDLRPAPGFAAALAIAAIHPNVQCWRLGNQAGPLAPTDR
jgi:4'-phosphopantetheinyl transferase